MVDEVLQWGFSTSPILLHHQQLQVVQFFQYSLLNIKIGEYICHKDNNGRKLGRLLAILNDNNSYKLKVQRILTYNELPRQFQSNKRAQIDPRLSRICNGFANLSNSLTHIMSNWFIIEEHPESDDNETKGSKSFHLGEVLLWEIIYYIVYEWE
ncbi:hypothetical protein RhiirA4_431904 [Rhizophagus irregularis]|uniref:Uncharacterized protein n=1 Tax=Rhizophagus irregularis TaxID=588596 RepID=A0A2I1HRQ2_9GLOM|nr:hypothetical protein RhiirA4_431904 [Rhizophagus irregularis]